MRSHRQSANLTGSESPATLTVRVEMFWVSSAICFSLSGMGFVGPSLPPSIYATWRGVRRSVTYGQSERKFFYAAADLFLERARKRRVTAIRAHDIERIGTRHLGLIRTERLLHR